MADRVHIDQQHNNAIARLERSAELTRQRQDANEARKERQRIQSSIIEGANAKELMELQHELNKENRLLDHPLSSNGTTTSVICGIMTVRYWRSNLKSLKC